MEQAQQGSAVETGTITREIHIDATPDVVYEVVSRPEHLREWWPDEAELGSFGGARGPGWRRRSRPATRGPGLLFPLPRQGPR